MYKTLTISFLTILLVACSGRNTKISTEPVQPPPPIKKEIPTNKKQSSKSGGYYLDDGPEKNPPKHLDLIPDATPRHEPINIASTRPYKALGKTYVPIKTRKAFRQTGRASWYGKRFHGRKTANGERYDMYAMTAAHKTLPLPSYLRVTNPANQKSVIVRVNDRGPFATGRIVDLSYAAAHRLDIVEAGSAPVIIETVTTTSVSTKVIDTPSSSAVVVKPQHHNSFYVQAGAFRTAANLVRLKQKILDAAITTREMVYEVYNNDLYKLRLGPYANQREASAAASMIRERLNLEPIINRN